MLHDKNFCVIPIRFWSLWSNNWIYTDFIIIIKLYWSLLKPAWTIESILQCTYSFVAERWAFYFFYYWCVITPFNILFSLKVFGIISNSDIDIGKPDQNNLQGLKEICWNWFWFVWFKFYGGPTQFRSYRMILVNLWYNDTTWGKNLLGRCIKYINPFSRLLRSHRDNDDCNYDV